MSSLFVVQGRYDLYANGQLQAYSQLMAPNHGKIPITGFVEGRESTLEVALRFVIDGNWNLSPFLHRVMTTDELADAWERSHHEHHGYDPRGLDPRVEPTRLTIGRR